MPLMTEAIDKSDWERMQKGLPPLPKKKVVMSEPEFPEVDNLLKFKDIPLDRFGKLISARRRNIRNKDGVMFIGYDVEIELKGTRGAGRPPINKEVPEPESRILSGWMIEGQWVELYRHIREKIDIRRVSL